MSERRAKRTSGLEGAGPLTNFGRAAAVAITEASGVIAPSAISVPSRSQSGKGSVAAVRRQALQRARGARMRGGPTGFQDRAAAPRTSRRRTTLPAAHLRQRTPRPTELPRSSVPPPREGERKTRARSSRRRGSRWGERGRRTQKSNSKMYSDGPFHSSGASSEGWCVQ